MRNVNMGGLGNCIMDGYIRGRGQGVHLVIDLYFVNNI